MPSKKKKIFSIIILNLVISLIIANKVTNLLFNNILLEVPTYLVIAGTSFTILSVISHKIWPNVSQEKPENKPLQQKPNAEKVIVNQHTNIKTKNLKLTRTLRKKL